jgi:hypothetical protein
MARALLALVPLLALPLAACAGKPMRTGGPLPPTLACDAAPARGAIGRQATAAVLEQVRRDSHAQVLRVIRPREAITMEFSAGRVDVRVDAGNAIVGVSCG